MTVSPVTHTAVVDVNSAGTKPIVFPLAEENGSTSNIVPTAMTPKNPSTIYRAGVIRFLIFLPTALNSCPVFSFINP